MDPQRRHPPRQEPTNQRSSNRPNRVTARHQQRPRERIELLGALAAFGVHHRSQNGGVDEADIMPHTRLKSLRIVRLYERTTGWWNRNPTTSMTL